MRHILSGLILSISCGVLFAAEVIIDPKMTMGPLGLGEYQPDALSGLPVVDVQIPLPGEVESNLPQFQGKPDGGFDFRGPGSNSFGNFAGMSALTSLDIDVELPGIDGLPIRYAKAKDSNVPDIPGFDGLPIGFGRQ